MSKIFSNFILLLAEKSHLFHEDDGSLTYKDHEVTTDGIGQPKHLYIFNDDEIKLGDWYLVKHNVEGHILSDNLILAKANKNFIVNHYIKESGFHFKVIKTSDKSLGIELLTEEFLKTFCDEYIPEKIYFDKLNIKIYKTNWTREEVEHLLRKAWRDSYTFYMPKFTYDFDATNKWIKNNIEKTEKF